MNIKEKKTKLAKRILISYSKGNSGKYYFHTDPTTSTITTTTTSTLTGIFNNVKS